ncbi:unnamed protein product [Ectocarpus sp. 4 AP-2014]
MISAVTCSSGARSDLSRPFSGECTHGAPEIPTNCTSVHWLKSGRHFRSLVDIFGTMGRAGVALAGWTILLCFSSVAAQNESCTTETCGVSTCEPGSELEVSLEGTSLEISCNLCLENFYKAEESADPCLACGDGLVSEVGAVVCTLEAGFWRTSNSESRGCMMS